MSARLAQAVEELTREEMEQFADEQARTYLNMSLDEFHSRAEADTLPNDNPMVVHIALLAAVELHTC